MDDQIQTIINGFRATVLENRSYKKIVRGIYGIFKLLTWLFGSVDPYFLMMALCMLTGLINFYIVLEFPGSTGGIQLMAGDSQVAQMWLSAIFVMYGAIIGYTKRMAFVSVGTLAWMWYAGGIFFGTISGQVIPQGLLASVVYVVSAIAIPAIVVSKMREAHWYKIHLESLATIKAQKEIIRDLNGQPAAIS